MQNNRIFCVVFASQILNSHCFLYYPRKTLGPTSVQLIQALKNEGKSIFTLAEVARGIWLKQKDFDWEKLLEYSKKFRTKAAVKRLGFILESLNLNKAAVKKLNQQISKLNDYALLDPQGNKQGRYLKRWKLQINNPGASPEVFNHLYFACAGNPRGRRLKGSERSLPDEFMFYGGTAIKRIYFEDHRYS